MKKFYFAGSIRGGRVDAELYRRIIEQMKSAGTVLTEHVGDLSLSAYEQSADRDALIYTQDTAWLREADMVIAECTCPSLGVGYELAYAEQHGIPCHVFYNQERTQLSAMIKGNPYFQLHPYQHEEELFEALKQVIFQ